MRLIGKRKWFVELLATLAVLLASAALGQSAPPEYEQAVPADLRWALSVDPSAFRFIELVDRVTRNKLEYSVVIALPGQPIGAYDTWDPNTNYMDLRDGRYRVTSTVVAIYRFDPLVQSVPEEPRGFQFETRRWLVSEPIAITVTDKNSDGLVWIKEGYLLEIQLLAALLKGECP